MRFQTIIAFALPALALAVPTPQDPNFEFPADTPDDDIVGGSTAASGEFPYIVSLQVGGSHICGGSLINGNTVVTAAHCSVSSVIGSVSNLRVRAGSLSRSSGGTLVGVSQVIVNPNYRSSSQDYDIAIWKLSSSIPTSSTIGYVGLPASGSDPAAGATVTVAGWGTLSSGGSSPNALYKVSVPVVSRTSCRSSYGSSSITNNMVCAGLTNGGKDSCQGDSGGPLVDASKTLVGVVSFGQGCALPGYPGVYSRVSTLLSFIQQYD
ncbi:Trypsin [Pyrenophora tritici-repentis]|uniref:Trypsin n=2 Tax=Pyrenophora tritici-repentis TaxID=45151 RepID=A0A922T0R1_9PLEO|nr:trypsin precursor [Pyrenophora tritici-repentis Pt-1C-BFP]EDU44173.1 trypsin precursor [Pyrenophora tritici-repentis Pt-1C-BFP]KAI1514602.1 Trypsin [Pyrenophora tritici-repentis]KAI1673189.1 Trypsin [Pyrenophora tritici-repentis]KAI1676981.1 Trypsin [Pyrenophora tritici-repentis]